MTEQEAPIQTEDARERFFKFLLTNVDAKVAASLKKIILDVESEIGREIDMPFVFLDSLEVGGWTATWNKFPRGRVLYIEFPHEDSYEFDWWGFDPKEIKPGIFCGATKEAHEQRKIKVTPELVEWMKGL